MNFLISGMHFCNSFEQIGNKSFVKIVYGLGRVQGISSMSVFHFSTLLKIKVPGCFRSDTIEEPFQVPQRTFQ